MDNNGASSENTKKSEESNRSSQSNQSKSCQYADSIQSKLLVSYLTAFAPEILQKSLCRTDEQKSPVTIADKSSKTLNNQKVLGKVVYRKEQRFNSDLTLFYLRERILEHRLLSDRMEKDLRKHGFPKKPQRRM